MAVSSLTQQQFTLPLPVQPIGNQLTKKMRQKRWFFDQRREMEIQIKKPMCTPLSVTCPGKLFYSAMFSSLFQPNQNAPEGHDDLLLVRTLLASATWCDASPVIDTSQLFVILFKSCNWPWTNFQLYGLIGIHALLSLMKIQYTFSRGTYKTPRVNMRSSGERKRYLGEHTRLTRGICLWGNEL